MDFRWPPGSAPSVPGCSPPAWFSHPQGPLPPPLLREHIIREAVTRRLNEEWAMGVHGGFRPGPFFAPDRLMPPPHAPMPMHPLPHAPPPVPFEGFGAWQGAGPRRHAGFGERTLFPREERRASPPRPDPKRKVKLPEIKSSGTPEALSPKVPMTKRKADANAATTVPKKVQKLAEDWSCALCQVSAPSEAGLNEHLGGRKHKAKLAQCGVTKAIKDDKNCLQTTTGNENSTDPCDAPKKICMLVDGATCEAGLNEHLGGRKHKAELALCGASKAFKDDKNGLHRTTGNKNSTDPCDAPKRVFLEVDGEMHEVVRKNNYLWCHCCRVRCYSNVIMDGHLRSKMHSKLNKVWTSIKAGRTNTNTREGLPCGSQVNTNDSTEIPGVIKGDINMTTEVDESSPVENPVQKEIHLQSKKHNKSNNVWTSIKALRTNTDTKKGLPSCGSQLNTNGPVENPVHKEIHLQSKKHSKLNKVWTSIKAVRTNTSTKEGLSSCGSQVNTNGSSEIPAVIEGDINMATEVDESGPVENPVWKEITRMAAIKAVRKNTDTKEGLPSCRSQVNTNGSTEIPAVTPRLKELIMFKAQQESKSDPSSAPKETYANDSSQKRKPSQMTSKVQPPAKKRKYNQPKKTVSSDDHRLKEQRADSRLQEAGEVSRGKAEALVEMKVEGDSKGGNTSSNQPKPYLHSDKCTAYMSKINLKATELHIRGFFSDIGGVVDIRLQRDRFTKKSRGLAHVDFSDKDHLEAAIRKNKRKFFGKNVTIKDSSKHKKNRKAGTSAKANTKVWTSIKAFLSKKASIAPSDPSKSKKNREADTSAKANTKVWTSIKAVRTNCNTKEGLPLPSSCGSQVNTNGSTKIPAVIKGDINMTTAVDESGPVENPVRKEITRMATIKAARTNTNTNEGLPSCGSQVNTDGSTEIPAVIEGDINMTTLVDESGPVENLVRKQITRMAAIKAVRTNTDTKEGLPSSCGSQVNTNGCTEIPAVIEGDLNMSTGVDESGPVENPVQKEITRMATIWAMFSS